MLNNPGLKFFWITSNTVGFIFPDIHRIGGTQCVAWNLRSYPILLYLFRPYQLTKPNPFALLVLRSLWRSRERVEVRMFSQDSVPSFHEPHYVCFHQGKEENIFSFFTYSKSLGKLRTANDQGLPQLLIPPSGSFCVPELLDTYRHGQRRLSLPQSRRSPEARDEIVVDLVRYLGVGDHPS
jgi:hypothetical protein